MIVPIKMDLTDMDAEMLGEILEHMSYAEILDWCRLHPRFRTLCRDQTTFVGQLLKRKAKEEIVARVWYVLTDAVNGKLVFQLQFPQKHLSIYIYLEQNTLHELIEAIDTGVEFEEVDLGDTLASTSLSESGLVYVESGGHIMSIGIPADLINSALKAGLRLKTLGEDWQQEFGYAVVSVGGETRFIDDRR